MHEIRLPVIITGTSSGLGRGMAVYLARKGLPVVATMRDLAHRKSLDAEAARRGAGLEVLQLDITDASSIHAAVETVLNWWGGIDAVVNQTGIQVRGFFEDVSNDEMRGVFETMALVRAVLPHMRRAGRGRIVLVTSVGGRLGHVAVSSATNKKRRRPRATRCSPFPFSSIRGNTWMELEGPHKDCYVNNFRCHHPQPLAEPAAQPAHPELLPARR